MAIIESGIDDTNFINSRLFFDFLTFYYSQSQRRCTGVNLLKLNFNHASGNVA